MTLKSRAVEPNDEYCKSISNVATPSFNMVVVAQLVEYQIVALRVMGSNPIFHPKSKKKFIENLEIRNILYIFAKQK